MSHFELKEVQRVLKVSLVQEKIKKENVLVTTLCKGDGIIID